MKEIGVTAVVGGITTFLFGGWNILLNVLLVLIVFDYITGMTASFFEGGLKSGVGFKGIARKAMTFGMISVAHLVDILLIESGYELGFVLSTTLALFYCVNEVLSIIENMGRMGVKIPGFLEDAIEVLRKKRNLEEKRKDEDK